MTSSLLKRVEKYLNIILCSKVFKKNRKLFAKYLKTKFKSNLQLLQNIFLKSILFASEK